jgi:hypothetical protein
MADATNEVFLYAYNDADGKDQVVVIPTSVTAAPGSKLVFTAPDATFFKLVFQDGSVQQLVNGRPAGGGVIASRPATVKLDRLADLVRRVTHGKASVTHDAEGQQAEAVAVAAAGVHHYAVAITMKGGAEIFVDIACPTVIIR